MCIRDSFWSFASRALVFGVLRMAKGLPGCIHCDDDRVGFCLLYTSDAADERSSVDLGGRRIIKKKNSVKVQSRHLGEANDLE